jgi:hypothetical protein
VLGLDSDDPRLGETWPRDDRGRLSNRAAGSGFMVGAKTSYRCCRCLFAVRIWQSRLAVASYVKSHRKKDVIKDLKERLTSLRARKNQGRIIDRLPVHATHK